MCAGLAAVSTDQEKLLSQLEEELEQSRELVRVQQQLLQVLILRSHSHVFTSFLKRFDYEFSSCDYSQL